MSQRWTASTRRGRLLALACVLCMLCSTEGCITGVHSFVAVEPLDLHEGYREYSDSLLSSGRLSLATRQALNLVPEAGVAGTTAAELAALGASERIDPATRAFARSEVSPGFQLLQPRRGALLPDADGLGTQLDRGSHGNHSRRSVQRDLRQ